MEQNNSNETFSPMPKPDNNMALAIFCTICCCLPFGIVAIIKASKVNSLYLCKQYEAAILTAEEAKKWSLIGIAVGFAVNVIFGIFRGHILESLL